MERQLSEIWGSQRIRPVGLVTGDGQNVTVLYPGRLNDGRGGDFCDAVVMVDGQKVIGDVELHVTSRDWMGHGHHKDAAYNQVVLHVVWRDTGGATKLQNGVAIPVLVLQDYVPVEAFNHDGHTNSPEILSSCPCYNVTARSGEASLAQLLDEAGDARFEANAAKIRQQIDAAGSEQALYEGIMTALGYSKNKAPFRELAYRLPLRIIERDVLHTGYDRETLFRHLNSLMLQVAGLVVSEPGVNIESMSAGDWDFFKVRPGNSPVARIGAAAHLLVRYCETGLLQGLLNLVRQAPPVRAEAYLQAGLLVAGIGRTRVDDIIANVLLPFALVFTPVNGVSYLGDTTLRLYRGYKRLASNCLERHMIVQLNLPPCLVNSARRQQGLLHIYKTMCIQAKCSGCALAQP